MGLGIGRKTADKDCSNRGLLASRISLPSSLQRNNIAMVAHAASALRKTRGAPPARGASKAALPDVFWTGFATELRSGMSSRSMTAAVVLRSMALSVGLMVTGCDRDPRPEPTPNATAGRAEKKSAPLPLLGGEAGLPQVELAAIYNRASVLLAEARGAAVFSQFRPVQQAQLTPLGDRLKVTATGNDAQLVLPAFIQGKQFIIQATIDSPAATQMEILYLRRGQTSYSDAQSQTAPLVKGRNVVYFRFNAPDMVDPLRVDIGAEPGDYTIESMIARFSPASR